MNDAGNNWSSLAPKFAFAHNTSGNHTIGEKPYKTVFGTEPQITMSLKLGLYRKKLKFVLNSAKTYYLILTVRTTYRIRYQRIFFDHNLHKHFWNRNATSKESIMLLSKDVENNHLDRMPTEMDSNRDRT